MMDKLGTIELTATLDARSVLTVIEALDLLVSIAQSYGHTFTPEQQAILSRAADVCERESLVITGWR